MPINARLGDNGTMETVSVSNLRKIRMEVAEGFNETTKRKGEAAKSSKAIRVTMGRM